MAKDFLVGTHRVSGEFSGFYDYLRGLEGIEKISAVSMNSGRGSGSFRVAVKYYDPTTRTFKLETHGRKSKVSWLVQLRDNHYGRGIEGKIRDYSD